MGAPTTVTVYTRADCHLCEEAIAVIHRVVEDLPRAVEVDLVDVDEDAGLREAYGERVPYVLVDGRPAFKYRVEADELRARLLAVE